MVDFLADYLGGHAEVVLHDLTDLEHSIVKIRNGHISGRKEGDPCTDFVLRVLQNRPEQTEYAANYFSTNPQGEAVKSGSYFIRDAKGEIVGMLCINVNTGEYTRMRAYMDSFFGIAALTDGSHVEDVRKENLGISLGDMVDSILSRTIKNCGCDPKLLSYEGKERLIEQLNEEGIFLLKGSVSKVAIALGLSDPSVYRYLSHLKKD